MCHIETWSTTYCMRTTEKVWRSKVKKIWFAECQKRTLGKEASLPSVRRRHSAKKLVCRVSKQNTRQRGGLLSVKKTLDKEIKFFF